MDLLVYHPDQTTDQPTEPTTRMHDWGNSSSVRAGQSRARLHEPTAYACPEPTDPARLSHFVIRSIIFYKASAILWKWTQSFYYSELSHFFYSELRYFSYSA
jgi:hypothetical protein